MGDHLEKVETSSCSAEKKVVCRLSDIGTRRRNIPDTDKVSWEAGITWEPRLPDSCRACLKTALENSDVQVEYFEPVLNVGDDVDNMDLYVVEGVGRLGRGDDKGRLAIQIVGIDTDRTNYGGELSRSTVEFQCKKT